VPSTTPRRCTPRQLLRDKSIVFGANPALREDFDDVYAFDVGANE
jgi:hypothetical protein